MRGQDEASNISPRGSYPPVYLDDEEEDDVVTISSDEEEGPKRFCQARQNQEEEEEPIPGWGDWIQTISDARMRDGYPNLRGSHRDLSPEEKEQLKEDGEQQNFQAFIREEASRKDHQVESHTHPYYRQAVEQQRKGGPPIFKFEYFAQEDDWSKSFTSAETLTKELIKKLKDSKWRPKQQQQHEIYRQEERPTEDAAMETQDLNEVNEEANEEDILARIRNKISSWESAAQEEKAKAGHRTVRASCTKTTTKCQSCQKTPDNKLKRCSRCKSSVYCNIICQQRDWKQHKIHCKKAMCATYDRAMKTTGRPL